MIEKIEITGNNLKIAEDFEKYAKKKIGKLDRYLPKENKKEVFGKIIISEIDRDHGNKYEISVSLEIPGGKVLIAKDESLNMFSGIDLIEAKLMGQIRRFKTESTSMKPKKSLKSLFLKRK